MGYDGEPNKVTWKDKVKGFFKRHSKIIVILLVGIWIFNLAQGANTLANKNAEDVQHPDYEVSYLPGGPDRFKDKFKSYLQNSEQEINPDQYLWGTIIVENGGNKVGSEITIREVASVPLAKVGYKEPGWGYTDVELNYKQGSSEAEIKVEALDSEEKLFVFIGLNPPGIEKPYNSEDKLKWARNYKTVQRKIVVDSAQQKEVVYGAALPKIYD